MSAVRYGRPLLLMAGLLLPSVVWLCLDHTVWSWDPAWYGYNSVNLWRTLCEEPGNWLTALETAMSDRAAGVCWVGQFFVPLGERFGSIDLGLALSIILTQLATLLVLWAVGRRLAPELGWRVPLVGCVLAAGAPLFVGLSHQFFVEPLQTLVVAWIYYLALAGPTFSRLQLFSQLLAAAALGMAAKVSTPLYCFLPGLLALSHMWPTRAKRSSRWQLALDLGCLLAAVGLTYVTLRWYSVNWRTTLDHVREASSGEDALNYGHQDLFWNKLKFWLKQARGNWMTLTTAYPIAAVLVAGAVSWTMRKWQGETSPSSHRRSDVLALLAFLQLVVVLVCFARTINEDCRYLLGALPSLAALAMWSAAQIPPRWAWIGWGFTLVLLLQWSAMNAITFGWIERPNQVSAYVLPVSREDAPAREAELLLDQLMAEEDTKQRCSIVADEQPWFNNTTLAYLNAKRQLAGKRSVNMTRLPWDCQDGGQALRFVQEANALYVIFPKDEQDPPEHFNRAAKPLFEILQTHAQFVREPFPSRQGLILFRRVTDLH